MKNIKSKKGRVTIFKINNGTLWSHHIGEHILLFLEDNSLTLKDLELKCNELSLDYDKLKKVIDKKELLDYETFTIFHHIFPYMKYEYLMKLQKRYLKDKRILYLNKLKFK